MLSLKIILILLSLYGVASTITYIVFIIKYNNLNNNCKLSINTQNDNNLRTNDNNTNKTNDSNTSGQPFLNLTNPFIDNNLSQIIQKYDIYYDADFYNKFDLLDEYSDKIIIYSKNINFCYYECDNNPKCYGFTKFNNYCFLKGEYDLSQKNNASKLVLVVNPNK
jgi:hypothetical protein